MSRPFFRLFLPLAILLAAGALYAEWLAEQADREMRATLVRQSEFLVRGMDHGQIAALSTSSDAQRPEYQRFKSQLVLVRSIYPSCRYIHLTVRKPDGSTALLVDSEPINSKEASLRGQIHSGDSVQFRRVFDTKAAGTQGPISDRWGVWVSALVPVLDPQTGAITAVLGMEVDARDWRWNRAIAALPAVVFTLALATLWLVGGKLLDRRSRETDSPAGWMRHLEAGLVLAVGIILSVFAGWQAFATASKRDGRAFSEFADQQAGTILDRLENVRDLQLEGLAQFYAARDNISTGEFEEFAKSLTKNVSITTWGWIPLVPAAEKEAFEAKVRNEGMPGFEIWQLNAQGKRIPAFGREKYYPVFQVAPPARIERVVGNDSGAEPRRLKALEEAEATGLTAGTDSVILSSETANRKSIVVYRPVYTRTDRQRLRGFVGAAVRMEQVLRAGTVPEKIAPLEIAMLHQDAAPESLAMTWDAAKPPGGPAAVRPLFAFEKVFTITVRPNPEMTGRTPLRPGVWTCCFGLVLTGAIGTIVRLVVRRRERLERMVAERTGELRESAQRYHFIISVSNTGAWEYRSDQDYLWCSPEYFSMLGFEDTDFDLSGRPNLRETWIDLLHPDDRESAAAHFTEYLNNGSVGTYEANFRMRHRNGEWTWIWSRGQTLRDADGKATNLTVGTHIDVTERRRAALELERAHHNLEKRIKELQCLYAISKLTTESCGTIAEVLQAALELVPQGWQFPEITRTRVTYEGQVVAAAGFEITPWRLVADIAVGRIVVGTVEVCYLEKRPDCDEGPFYAEERTLLLGIAAQFGVMIERRRAEEKLWRLSTTIEQAPLSVIITDLTSAIEYANPKCCAVTGYTRDELLGQNTRIFKSGEMPEAIYRELWQTITSGHVWTGEMRNRRKNGDIFLETLVVAPLVDRSGRVTHYVALKDDITAQKRFEAETTAMLAKERELSGMKSQFISVASHEFRTPLAAALGSLELLERHAGRLTESKRVELLVRAQRSLGRLTTIMDEVLQLSRADSGRVKVQRMAVNLVRFAQDVVKEVAEADRNQHAFAFEQLGRTDPVPVDTQLLHHILSNLVGNAVRYSPPNTRVSITLALDEKAYSLTVADEGIGIPEAERDRIFEPFVRGSNVGSIGGTGLGLNIVKRYTELMGGRIEIVPSNRGATFRIQVPYA